jgi:FkbM family methyltransferase
MNNLYQTLHFIFNHPATRNKKWKALGRFVQWQMHARIFNVPVVYPFIEGTLLVIKRGMTGATGNIYTGLHEFEEMMFLLHVLRPEDLFCDVGANIGSYTILAAGVARARTFSFEPVPSTFLHLKRNVAINALEDLVELYNCGVGEKTGTLRFTSGGDTVNHVITDQDTKNQGTVEVAIKTLDQVLEGREPWLIKIDVEGFELSVLAGGKKMLEHPGLKAIIIEINGLSRRYGATEDQIHQFLLSFGFFPFSYDAFKRILHPLKQFNSTGNTIYLRDKTLVEERIFHAKKIAVLDQMI